MRSEIGAAADFSIIRYAQCWEDADVLLRGLDVRPGDRCLSVASAGDNTLAMLIADPASVLAVDLSPAQLACLALRIAAYRALEHHELLELMGSRPSDRRRELYDRCVRVGRLEPEAAGFWNGRKDLIDAGVGSVGRFERYFAVFRRFVLPLVHGRGTVGALLEKRDPAARRAFYRERWDSRRWRAIFLLFFSRAVMGRLGRDPAFFRYVESRVGPRIMVRARHALTRLDPPENPYLAWILTGRHGDALPLALRAEHFEAIRSRVDRVAMRSASVEEAVAGVGAGPFQRFNLSDIFEYMSAKSSAALLGSIAACSTPGARLVYWNMLVPRSAPPELRDRIRPRRELARSLHREDKAFFYRRLVVEEVVGP